MRKTLFGLVAAAGLAVASTVSAQEIVIAVAGPMTGSNASFGEQFRRGAEMAVADINAQGGVIGRKLGDSPDFTGFDQSRAHRTRRQIQERLPRLRAR